MFVGYMMGSDPPWWVYVMCISVLVAYFVVPCIVPPEMVLSVLAGYIISLIFAVIGIISWRDYKYERDKHDD